MEKVLSQQTPEIKESLMPAVNDPLNESNRIIYLAVQTDSEINSGGNPVIGEGWIKSGRALIKHKGKVVHEGSLTIAPV